MKKTILNEIIDLDIELINKQRNIINKLENENKTFSKINIIYFLIIVFLLFCVIILINMNINNKEKLVSIDNYSFLNAVNQKCGSLYFVFKDNEYQLFKQTCLNKGYCKYDYVKLEDCLK